MYRENLPRGNSATIKRPMARRKLFENQANLNLLLSEEMVERIDSACEEGESRTQFIRSAIQRELKRRTKARGDERGRR